MYRNEIKYFFGQLHESSFENLLKKSLEHKYDEFLIDSLEILKYSKYEISSVLSNIYKSKIEPNRKYNLEDLIKFSKQRSKKRYFRFALISSKMYFKYLYFFLVPYLKFKTTKLKNVNVINKIVISSQNHYNQLPLAIKQEFKQSSTLIFDIDRPFKSFIAQNDNHINIHFPLLLKFLKNTFIYFHSVYRLMRYMSISQMKDYVFLDILIRSLGKTFIYAELFKLFRTSDILDQIISTKPCYFDFIVFAMSIKNRRNIKTTSIVHGIIEDPFYYNSCLDELFVLGEYDKNLMSKIGDYTIIKTIKNNNIKLTNIKYAENKSLLLTLTAGEGITTEYIDKFFINSRFILSQLDYENIIIRPHPKTNINTIMKKAKSIFCNYNVEISSDQPISSQLERSAFCISMFSSILLYISDSNIGLIVSIPTKINNLGIVKNIPEKYILEYFINSNIELLYSNFSGKWFNNLYFGK